MKQILAILVAGLLFSSATAGNYPRKKRDERKYKIALKKRKITVEAEKPVISTLVFYKDNSPEEQTAHSTFIGGKTGPDKQFSLYPRNNGGQFILLSPPLPTEMVVDIVNANGGIVYQEKIPKSEFAQRNYFDIDEYPKGDYNVYISDKQNMYGIYMNNEDSNW